MSDTKYIRNGKTITSVEKDDKGNPVEKFSFNSINQAKKKSRELQMSNDGALGLGCVVCA